MMKKPSDKYESPVIEVLYYDVNDIVTASGDNYVEWDWEDKTFDDGLFS